MKMTEKMIAIDKFVTATESKGRLPRRFMEWQKQGIDVKDREIAMWFDSEEEILAEASTKGFNGSETIIIGDDMYFTGKAVVLNGKVIKWGIFDEENVMIGDCRDYETMMLYFDGKDINETVE